MIYKIEYDGQTKTYRVYKRYHPVELRSTKTAAMTNFMRIAEKETKGFLTIYKR